MLFKDLENMKEGFLDEHLMKIMKNYFQTFSDASGDSDSENFF